MFALTAPFCIINPSLNLDKKSFNVFTKLYTKLYAKSKVYKHPFSLLIDFCYYTHLMGVFAFICLVNANSVHLKYLRLVVVAELIKRISLGFSNSNLRC